MKLFETMAEMGHEEVVMCSDPSIGYRGILAVHSTKLGPALGGTRFWQYATDEEAITDALRLSRGMTYKNAVAGLAGKSGDPSPVTAHGVFRAVQASANHKWSSDSLEGKTVTIMGCGSV